MQLLSKFVEDFLSKGDLIAEELTRQIGRPISQAPGELRGFKERADYMLSIAERKLANIDISKDGILKVYKKKIAWCCFCNCPMELSLFSCSKLYYSCNGIG